MKKTWKRLCTGFLALATVVTALPTTPVHAESKQYWTESKERVGIVEKVMNDGSIGSTFNEGHLTVEGEDAYCIDINTDFKNGYKTRADASSRMSTDQISDVALSIEYVKQYTDSHSGISKNHAYLLRQLVVWQRLSVHLGWQCDNVRASYDEIQKATQDEVFSGAKAFVKENKGRYECGGYIYSGEGQELGQFWAKLNVGNAKLQKTSSNTSITDGNENERAYYAVRDLLTYYDAEQTAFSIINQYVRFVDEEADKRKNDWKLNDRWAWFIGDNRQSLKLTTKPEPYTLDRTLRWVQRQVAPTLKMLKRIDKGNGTDYMKTIEQQAKLTEKHEMIIKQQTTPAKDLVES